MITRIRDVRKAKGLTLDDVGRRCEPPTTAQTIGRLETGTRTVSVGWLNRIAEALGVDAADLVDHPERAELQVIAVLGSNGAHAPKRPGLVVPPRNVAGQVAMTVGSSIGDYRAGDEVWLARLAPDTVRRMFATKGSSSSMSDAGAFEAPSASPDPAAITRWPIRSWPTHTPGEFVHS